jgi:hypothetical protein
MADFMVGFSDLSINGSFKYQCFYVGWA